jgi:alpha-glucosidase (family GH31 glycosyl hydrolase)
VQIGPETIVVSTPGAKATITRTPFRIQFSDASGRTVLQEVENSGPAPQPLPPLPDPAPLGGDSVDGPTVYSPLTFTVGTGLDVQYPASTWVANRLTGAMAGVQYAAGDVVDARREGEGARLELSTNDPSGRRLIVTVAPGEGHTIRVSVRPSDAGGVMAMGDSFASSDGEAFRGFGGRHNSIDQRGNDFYNWVEQQNLGAGPLEPVPQTVPGLGGDTYLFPNGPMAAFYVQSQFISSRGYGFLLERDELSGWRMASDRPDAWQVTVAGTGLDYLVAPGDGPTAIGAITQVSGRHRIPPDWAPGPQLDRLTRFTGETAESYRRFVEQDLDDIERYDLPLTAYRFEAWVWLDRDFLRQAIERLRRRGIRSLLYFRAFVGRDEIGTDDPAAYDEALANGYVATTASGGPYVFIGNFYNLTALIDFTKPEAVAWWERRIRQGLDLGADGFMQDFGEQVQNDMRFANGETGASMHNRFPVLFHRTTREVVERYERAHPGREIWFFTRAGYSGTPGSAEYESSNFPGDETTDWSRSSGLASLATDMLNRAVGGAFGYGTDVGGYVDFHTPATTKELFIRWAEWAALSPVMRLHGSINAGTHTPWTFDQETVRIYDALSKLHIRARPLILRLWREAARTGIPITRPLWLEFPDDAEAARQDQEWLLGPDVLVAPVVREGALGREVYFPRGCWEHPETAEVHDGPGSARVDAPLGRLPYFFRCGTNPFAQASGRPGCLARRSPIGPRNIGRVRIGFTRRRLLRLRVGPIRRTRRSFRYCVKRSRGRVTAVFGRRGRVVLVTTTAPAHGNRGVRPGAPAARLRAAYPRRRGIGRGLVRSWPRSPRLVGVRRGRVRFVAVAGRGLLRTPRALRRHLRLAGLQRGG